VNGDLADSSVALSLLDRVQANVIVNLAANTSVDDCERHPQCAYLTNVRLVENIADWIRRNGVKSHLIHISTDQVYDGPGPHSEADVTLTNYYAFSKYAGELAATAVGAVVLRTNFFGPSHCEGRQSISDWLVRSFRESKPITVFDDVHFNPLSIARLCAVIGEVVLNPVPGIYNLGSREGMTKAAFAFALARVTGLSASQAAVGSSNGAKLVAYRPKDMRMDCARFERSFGVTLPRLAEEIESMRSAYAQ
jgi:dTDP-4-dehydrorhamnose reductase